MGWACGGKLPEKREEREWRGKGGEDQLPCNGRIVCKGAQCPIDSASIDCYIFTLLQSTFTVSLSLCLLCPGGLVPRGPEGRVSTEPTASLHSDVS